MKHLKILLLLLVGFISSHTLLGQNKKQQITTLKAKVDSLKSAMVVQLDKNTELRTEISKLKSTINQKSKDNTALTVENRNLKQVVDDLKVNLVNSESELQKKSDSIAVLKLNQAPVPENNYPKMAKEFTEAPVDLKRVSLWLKVTPEDDLFTEKL